MLSGWKLPQPSLTDSLVSFRRRFLRCAHWNGYGNYPLDCLMLHFSIDVPTSLWARVIFASWLITVSVQNVRPCAASAESLMLIDWARQFGSPAADFGRSVAVDALGNVFVTGVSFVPSSPASSTQFDYFLSKFDRFGTLLWEKTIQTEKSEASNSVGIDGAGNAYITGWVTATMSTGDNRDVFVAKYDTNGNELWLRTVGTTSDEGASDISVDIAGNAIIGGATTGNFGNVNAGLSDAFIEKVDNNGNLLWTKQFGSAGNDAVRSLTVDRFENIYVAGDAVGKLGETHFGIWDAYAAKFDRQGVPMWTRQIGTPGSDSASSITVDSKGNSYIAGHTDSSLGGTYQGGQFDAFVAKIDEGGVPVWLTQLGTNSYDRGNAIAIDGKDNVYVGGFAFAGDPRASLAMLSNDGTLAWTQPFGARHNGDIEDITMDSLGIPYLIGQTSKSDWAPTLGQHDAFVIKLTIPEPATFLLLMIVFCDIAVRTRRQH
jgi:hypothetical protein